MVLFHQVTVSLFVYTITCVAAVTLPSASANSTTPELTKRQILHVGDAEDFWCNRVLFKDYESESCNGRTYYSGRVAPDIEKTTDISTPTSKDSLLLIAANPHGITTVCDFVLPPSFVLKRLREKGVCRVAATRSNGIAAITKLFELLDVKSNRRKLQRERVANYKARVVGGTTISGAGRSTEPLERYQIMHYVTSQQTNTLAIAKSIDNAVFSAFRLRSTIESDWGQRMALVMQEENLLKTAITRSIQCQQDPGSPMDTSHLWRKRTKKMETIFHSGFESPREEVSSMPQSSLERRARSAVRSGPKAAKAPSCPKKNQPPKKIVPRSEVQTKPKPAVKPRQPTKAPEPRKPSPTKKVTPRPATRARRVPGKSEPQKRITPKVKPRVVPKPTRKPKGKPRTRRRK